jgi:hypothetical protein
MDTNINRRNNVVRWAIAAVIVIDLVLAIVSWRTAQSPQDPQDQLRALELQRKLMSADVTRDDQIRGNLPAVEADSENFFHDQFRPMGTGYSSLSADLGQIAQSAGLKADATTFEQHKPDAHGIVELDITESIEGSYPSVVAFLNGLEQSHGFYILDGLSLSSSHEGSLRLALQLRTFFRTT